MCVRILMCAEEEIRIGVLSPKTGAILETIRFRGELPRWGTDELLGTSPRHARRAVSALIERKVVTSEGPRDPLRLVFPAALASRWMPGLFSEAR